MTTNPTEQLIEEVEELLARNRQTWKVGRSMEVPTDLLRRLVEEVKRQRALNAPGEKSDVFSDEYAALGHDERDSDA